MSGLKTYLVTTDIINPKRNDTCHWVKASNEDSAIKKVRYRLLGREGYYHPIGYWTAKEITN